MKEDYVEEKCRFIAMMCIFTMNECTALKVCCRVIGKYFNKPIYITTFKADGKTKGLEFANKEYKTFNLLKYPKIADEIFEEVKKIDINEDSQFIKQAISAYIKFFE